MDQTLAHVVDSCSSHIVPLKHLSNVETILLPPQTVSTLQPISASIGRLVESAYRRILVSNLLN